jgi:hypothetical protein
MMKNFVRYSIAALFCLSGSITLAGDFDGSKPLICAPVVVMDCVVGTGCTKGTPAEMGAPAFMRIDFEKKVVIGPKRASPILLMDKSAEQVLLQGIELGFGWTLALDAEGKMISTMVDHTGAFVMFGPCTPL